MIQIEGWNWFKLDEVGSTNDEAKKLLQNKSIITADRQTNGRGRRGRYWISISGNLFCSFILSAKPQQIGALSFIFSLSLLETINELNPKLDVSLKWPNDVLIASKKVSGILIEKGEGDFFIVGVGVNIKSHPKNPDLLYKSTSLKINNIQIDNDNFLKLYINNLNNNISLGFSTIKDKWLKFAKGLGEEIVVSLDNEQKTGIFTGIDDNGYLMLKTNNKIERIYTGDVFYKEQ